MYRCSKCKGTNIQVKAWIDPNTNEYIDDIDDNGDCWCEDCFDYIKMEEYDRKS